MAKELVTDELWEVIEPLLTEGLPRPQDSRSLRRHEIWSSHNPLPYNLPGFIR